MQRRETGGRRNETRAQSKPDPPEQAGEWLKVRLANLAVMYQATQAISHILDTDTLLPQILQLVFESIDADRGAILLADETGELMPKVC